MANSTLGDNIDDIKKELNRISGEYNMAIEESHRLGATVKELFSEEELKDMASTLYSIAIRLKDQDEENRFKAIILYNSVSSLL